MLTSGIFYLLMGVATGLVIFGLEILFILFIFRLIESWDNIKEMKMDLKQMKSQQKALELNLKGLAGLGLKIEQILKMRNVEG